MSVSEQLPDYGTIDPSTVTTTGLPSLTDFYPSSMPSSTPDAVSTGYTTVTPTITVIVDPSGNLVTYTPLPSASLATTVASGNAASVTASLGVSGQDGYSIVGWPQSSPAPNSTGGALSNGAKLAIGLSVSLVAVALLLILGWLCVRRQRRLRREKTERRMGEWRRASQELAQQGAQGGLNVRGASSAAGTKEPKIGMEGGSMWA